MSTLMQSISNLINEEILKFVRKVNEEYPEIPVNAMLEIWRKQQEIPFPKQELKTCQYVYDRGRKANAQCKMKVKENDDYCSL